MRLIDADAFVKYLENEIRLMEKDGANPYALMIAGGAINDVDRQPTIEPKRGEWIPVFDDRHRLLKVLKCNLCDAENHFFIEDERNFCPNCGADMREREGE